MKDIEYGFIKEMLTPYCYCRSPQSKGMYIIGSMMPMTILGAVVCVFGIVFASPILMLIGGFQFGVAGVAASTVSCQILSALALMLYTHKNCPPLSHSSRLSGGTSQKQALA